MGHGNCIFIGNWGQLAIPRTILSTREHLESAPPKKFEGGVT